MEHSAHGTGCNLSPRRREGLAIYTGGHPELVTSTGHPYKVREDNRSQLIKDNWPSGDNSELQRSWPCLLPTMGRSGSCPLAPFAEEPVKAQRRAQRGEAAAAVVGQVGTEAMSGACLLSRMFWAGFGFLRGKP